MSTPNTGDDPDRAANPWARPSADDGRGWTPPGGSAGSGGAGGSAPAEGPTPGGVPPSGTPSSGAPSPSGLPPSPYARPGSDPRAGSSGPPSGPAANPYAPPAAPRVDVLAGGPRGGEDSPTRDRSTLLGFGIAGGVVLAVGLVLVLVLTSSGFFSSGDNPFLGPAGAAPTPVGAPLARLCPPASGEPLPPDTEAPAPVDGPRIVDPDVGISYLRLGAPFKPWDRGVWDGGTLDVQYRTGYYFTTEIQPDGRPYLASVLTGKVPATVGDSLSLNLECAGRQVAEDARRSFYPEPNVKEQVRDERVVLAGRPAWVSTFHLAFPAAGLKAKGEQVAVVLVDVGRPTAAVLYISIPDTHPQYRPDIDRVIASVQPA